MDARPGNHLLWLDIWYSHCKRYCLTHIWSILFARDQYANEEDKYLENTLKGSQTFINVDIKHKCFEIYKQTKLYITFRTYTLVLNICYSLGIILVHYILNIKTNILCKFNFNNFLFIKTYSKSFIILNKLKRIPTLSIYNKYHSTNNSLLNTFTDTSIFHTIYVPTSGNYFCSTARTVIINLTLQILKLLIRIYLYY